MDYEGTEVKRLSSFARQLEHEIDFILAIENAERLTVNTFGEESDDDITNEELQIESSSIALNEHLDSEIQLFTSRRNSLKYNKDSEPQIHYDGTVSFDDDIHKIADELLNIDFTSFCESSSTEEIKQLTSFSNEISSELLISNNDKEPDLSSSSAAAAIIVTTNNQNHNNKCMDESGNDGTDFEPIQQPRRRYIRDKNNSILTIKQSSNSNNNSNSEIITTDSDLPISITKSKYNNNHDDNDNVKTNQNTQPKEQQQTSKRGILSLEEKDNQHHAPLTTPVDNNNSSSATSCTSNTGPSPGSEERVQILTVSLPISNACMSSNSELSCYLLQPEHQLSSQTQMQTKTVSYDDSSDDNHDDEDDEEETDAIMSTIGAIATSLQASLLLAPAPSPPPEDTSYGDGSSDGSGEGGEEGVIGGSSGGDGNTSQRLQSQSQPESQRQYNLHLNLEELAEMTTLADFKSYWETQDLSVTAMHRNYTGLFTSFLDSGGCVGVYACEVVLRPDVSLTRIMDAIRAVAAVFPLHVEAGNARSHLILEATDSLRGKSLQQQSEPADKKTVVKPVALDFGWKFIDVQVALSRELRQRVLVCVFMDPNTKSDSKRRANPVVIQAMTAAVKRFQLCLETAIVNDKLALSFLYKFHPRNKPTPPSSTHRFSGRLDGGEQVLPSFLKSTSSPQPKPIGAVVYGDEVEDGVGEPSWGLDDHYLCQLQAACQETMWEDLKRSFTSLETYVDSIETNCARMLVTVKPVYRELGVPLPMFPPRKSLQDFPLPHFTPLPSIRGLTRREIRWQQQGHGQGYGRGVGVGYRGFNDAAAVMPSDELPHPLYINPLDTGSKQEMDHSNGRSHSHSHSDIGPGRLDITDLYEQNSRMLAEIRRSIEEDGYGSRDLQQGLLGFSEDISSPVNEGSKGGEDAVSPRHGVSSQATGSICVSQEDAEGATAGGGAGGGGSGDTDTVDTVDTIGLEWAEDADEDSKRFKPSPSPPPSKIYTPSSSAPSRPMSLSSSSKRNGRRRSSTEAANEGGRGGGDRGEYVDVDVDVPGEGITRCLSLQEDYLKLISKCCDEELAARIQQKNEHTVHLIQCMCDYRRLLVTNLIHNEQSKLSELCKLVNRKFIGAKIETAPPVSTLIQRLRIRPHSKISSHPSHKQLSFKRGFLGEDRGEGNGGKGDGGGNEIFDDRLKDELMRASDAPIKSSSVSSSSTGGGGGILSLFSRFVGPASHPTPPAGTLTPPLSKTSSSSSITSSPNTHTGVNSANMELRSVKQPPVQTRTQPQPPEKSPGNSSNNNSNNSNGAGIGSVGGGGGGSGSGGVRVGGGNTETTVNKLLSVVNLKSQTTPLNPSNFKPVAGGTAGTPPSLIHPNNQLNKRFLHPQTHGLSQHQPQQQLQHHTTHALERNATTNSDNNELNKGSSHNSQEHGDIDSVSTPPMTLSDNSQPIKRKQEIDSWQTLVFYCACAVSGKPAMLYITPSYLIFDMKIGVSTGSTMVSPEGYTVGLGRLVYSFEDLANVTINNNNNRQGRVEGNMDKSGEDTFSGTKTSTLTTTNNQTGPTSTSLVSAITATSTGILSTATGVVTGGIGAISSGSLFNNASNLLGSAVTGMIQGSLTAITASITLQFFDVTDEVTALSGSPSRTSLSTCGRITAVEEVVVPAVVEVDKLKLIICELWDIYRGLPPGA